MALRHFMCSCAFMTLHAAVFGHHAHMRPAAAVHAHDSEPCCLAMRACAWLPALVLPRLRIPRTCAIQQQHACCVVQRCFIPGVCINVTTAAQLQNVPVQQPHGVHVPACTCACAGLHQASCHPNSPANPATCGTCSRASAACPQVRRVLDQIRGRSYEEAIMILEYMPYKVRFCFPNATPIAACYKAQSCVWGGTCVPACMRTCPAGCGCEPTYSFEWLRAHVGCVVRRSPLSNGSTARCRRGVAVPAHPMCNRWAGGRAAAALAAWAVVCCSEKNAAHCAGARSRASLEAAQRLWNNQQPATANPALAMRPRPAGPPAALPPTLRTAAPSHLHRPAGLCRSRCCVPHSPPPVCSRPAAASTCPLLQACEPVLKTLLSAAANAKQNLGALPCHLLA